MRTLFTIATFLWLNYQFLFWNNGDLEISDPMRDFEENPEGSTLPHIRMDKNAVRALRDFLNRPEIRAFLDQ